MKNFLVTGAAGFIGFHVSKTLLERGDAVTGYDNLNEYYDVSLKLSRLGLLKEYPRFSFIKGALEDATLVHETILQGFDAIIHLAAQAGVRYSLEHPETYIFSNLVGTFNILEAVKASKTPHVLYASSSSVYGANEKTPFSVDDKTDSPVSLYAATKKSNELMAYSYSHLFNIPLTGLRFFTVYGPYGRPDMALFKFTKNILEDKPIEIYNNGDMYRDFTYIGDIVKGVVELIDKSRALNTKPPYAVYNIGNHTPVRLSDFVSLLENALGKRAEKIYRPMQPGDVYQTYADVDMLMRDTGFKPETDLRDGIMKFVEWYRNYYSRNDS
jgi:UDP-glucuronate 4-epimerase